MKTLKIDLLDGGMPVVKTKIGESSGKTLYSVDGNAWYSSEAMAIDVYERKQRIIMEKRNERD